MQPTERNISPSSDSTIEEALQRSEERYRTFVAQSSEAIWRVEIEPPLDIALASDEQIDHCYQHVYMAECNDVMARMYGYTAAHEIVGARLGDLLPPSDPANRAYLRAFIEAGYRLIDAESHELDRYGESRYFLNNLIGVVEDGRLIRAWGTQRDITERKRIETALRRSEQRYRSLFTSIDQGFCIIEVLFDNATPYDYRFLEINSVFEQQTGLTNPQGKTARELVPGLESHWFELYGSVAQSGNPIRFIDSSDAMGRWFDVYAFRIGEPEEHAVAILFTDITERKHEEQRSQERGRLLSTLLKVSDAARKLGDEVDIARAACRLVKEETSAISCSYGFVYPENDRVLIMTDICDTSDGVPSMEGEWALSSFGSGLIALHTQGDPVVIEDTAVHPATAALQRTAYDTVHTRSLISIPLIRDGRFVAFFSIRDRLPRRYTTAEVSLLRDVAVRVWEAVQRARAEAALRASEARQSLLLRLLQGQRETNDPNAMMAAASEGVGRMLGANRVGFFEMADHDTMAFGVSWTDGTLAPLSGLFPATGIGTRYLAEVRAGRTLGIADTAREPMTADSLFGEIGARAIIGAPIIRSGRWRAGLYVNHSEVREWSGDEIALVHDVADQTWDAVERARAQQALRESEARLLVLYAQEQAARTQAEEASRVKDEFLATVSHELRTPLTAFLGYAQMLQARKRDEAYIARAVDRMVRSAKMQAQLIDDLLDISRIVSGKLRIERRPTDFTGVIRTALDTVRPTMEAKELNLQLDIDPAAGMVHGDANRLQQVVWNLLSNAAKFTPPGGTIGVRLEPQGGNIQLTVSDTGQGISAEFLPYVFDRFRQAESASTRSYGGLGLGLAIVRQLVELHGGSVSVASAGEGHGASFIVRLPRAGGSPAAPHDNKLPDIQSAFCPPELHGLRVLIVDDQPDILEILHDMLTPCGAIVRTYLAAQEALDAVRAWQPDVLICDLAMPDKDGHWLIQQLRALPPEAGGATPALALTAYARVEERMQLLTAGFQLYVSKPVEQTELRDVVARLAHMTGAE